MVEEMRTKSFSNLDQKLEVISYLKRSGVSIVIRDKEQPSTQTLESIYRAALMMCGLDEESCTNDLEEPHAFMVSFIQENKRFPTCVNELSDSLSRKGLDATQAWRFDLVIDTVNYIWENIESGPEGEVSYSDEAKKQVANLVRRDDFSEIAGITDKYTYIHFAIGGCRVHANGAVEWVSNTPLQLVI